MIIVGLTGNIGSGKSTIAGIFSILNVPVYHADQESKKFLDEIQVRDALISRFGDEIMTGTLIDRRKLAATVFNDTEALQFLNATMHPLVRKSFGSWVSHQVNAPYVVQEAAIIFENGLQGDYDYIIHVSCPEKIAIDRVVKRDAVDGNLVRQRMQHQLPDNEKARKADFVIINDGLNLLIPQVLDIHKILLKIGS